MENINNNQDTTNVQPISNKSDKNIFKILFFITLFVLIGTIIVSFFLIKKNEQQSDNNIDNIATSIKESTQISATPNSVTEENKNYEALSLQDNINSVTKLILKDSQGLETVIDEAKYWEMNDKDNLVAKPEFNKFTFSPDDNFLYYLSSSGWEASNSYLYDIKNKKKTDIKFSAETSGFTSDSKYFYACAEGGMMWGGAILIDLTQNKNIFSDIEDSSYTCKYSEESGEVTFNMTSPENIVGKYIFSQKTGKLSTTK